MKIKKTHYKMGLLIGTGDFGLEELLIQTVAARDQAIAAAETASSEYVDKGPYNATTNTPALTADATAGQGSGKRQKYNVTVPGVTTFAGKNFTVGTALKIGDQLYQFSDGQWYLQVFAVGDGTITTSKIADGAVTVDKLTEWVRFLFTQLPDDSPYMYALVDAMNRLAFAVRKDGYLEGKFVIQALNLMADSVATVAIQNGAVNYQKLNADVTGLFPGTFDNTHYDYVQVWIDASNRIALAILKDGSIMGKFKLSDGNVTEIMLAAGSVSTGKLSDLSVTGVKIAPLSISTTKIENGAVTLDKLNDSFKASIPVSFDATDSDYIYLLLDSMNRIGFGIKKDGTLIAKVEIADNSITPNKIPDGSITAQKLSAELLASLLPTSFLRLNSANSNDVEVDLEDDWRDVALAVPVKTHTNGFAYNRFAPTQTKALRGVNNTGTSLQFRNSNNVNIKGRRYRGTFDPTTSGVLGTNFRGVYGNAYSNSYPAFVAGSIGDCWMANVNNTPGATITANGLTFKNGDLIVQTGASSYAVQPGPGDGSFVDGDFWNVVATSKFGQIQLTASQRIIFVGFLSASGPKHVQLLPSKIGEFFIMGECDPTTFNPASQLDGDMYICSSAGTAKTLAVLESDSIVYEGAWFIVPGFVKTVPNGGAVFLPCKNANDWEVRRTDKNASSVILSLTGSNATLRRRYSDNLRLVSDSMFGSGGIASKIIALAASAGRSGSVRSNGGATSEDILAMLEMDIRLGDPYAGQFHIIWHGQNNPSNSIAQTQTCALQMAAILGIKQRRFMFWSILGARYLAYNGTRMVAATQEGAFAGTNFIANTEKWYELAFPKQWWSPRKAALELAVTRTNVPDPNFPGMSEAQVAADYGIIPFSFFFDYASKAFTASQLVHKGDWTTLALPTEPGVNNDYYRRTVATSGTVVGSLIVFTGGAWVEYVVDVIHLSPEGGTALSSYFYSNKLTTINL